ncbi:MAG: lipid A export permease/ATP-binding protein MsbA [Gammaproteobacteria bacterium TMED112]|nr:MAG: lipid A export permease/ATP-binding protein MsbA [Gammaproteobacteria bacterium TMED112]|tara:strand:- start:7357 stop:10104 length:2748 start_codon:yes stop_codon:yes gene_type:complete
MNKSLYTRLLGYTFKHKGLFFLSIFGFFLFSAADISAVEWLKQVISYINENNDNPLNPTNLALFLAFIAVVRGIGFYVGNYFMANIGQKVVHSLRKDLISSLLYQPMNLFDQASKGEIVNRIVFTTNQITGAATDALKIFFKEGFLLVGLFVYLLYLSWKLTLVILVIAPLIGIIVSIAGKRLRRVAKKIQDVMGVVTQVSSEIASGAREIKSFNNESGEEERFKRANDENLKQNLKMESTGNIATPLIQIFVAFALAAMSYLALTNLDDLNLPSESFVAFFTAAGLMARPIRQLSNLNGIIQRGLAAAEDIFTTIDNSPEKYNEGLDINKTLEGEVHIDSVSFSYSHDSVPVLNNISIKASKGETIALVGKSGSGKSTIVNLLNRFYDNYEGKITIDGYDIKKVKLTDLRNSISYVSQNPTLFNDTVKNNIAYGLDEVSDSEVFQAAREANAYEFIMGLSEGFNTIIGDKGVTLSGGEKQRVAIARALLKKSSILIFDEATSALDNESEKEIQSAIEKASKNKTTFIIAHRLSTVERADQICVLENGEITQSGTHSELIKEEGLYNILQGKPEQIEDEESIHLEKDFVPTLINEKISFWDEFNFGNIALTPLSFLYWSVSTFKNSFLKPKSSSIDEIPVVVVGNVTVGGNGKTPLVSQIATDLKNMGYKPGIVLRGYKGTFTGTRLVNKDTTAKEVGDEAIFHFKRGFDVVVDRDRARALSYIERHADCDIVISDDGLQHSSLRRDFEIIVEDATRNFGNRFFLPAGPLRDNIWRTKNVDLFIYSGRRESNDNFFELEPESWVNLETGESYLVDEYPFGSTANVICAIANPNRFLRTLNNLKINFDYKLFPDHHYFKKKDLEFGFERPILTTEKDAARMGEKFNAKNVWYLKMGVKLNTNISKLITEKLQQKNV